MFFELETKVEIKGYYLIFNIEDRLKLKPLEKHTQTLVLSTGKAETEQHPLSEDARQQRSVESRQQCTFAKVQTIKIDSDRARLSAAGYTIR